MCAGWHSPDHPQRAAVVPGRGACTGASGQRHMRRCPVNTREHTPAVRPRVHAHVHDGPQQDPGSAKVGGAEPAVNARIGVVNCSSIEHARVNPSDRPPNCACTVRVLTSPRGPTQLCGLCCATSPLRLPSCTGCSRRCTSRSSWRSTRSVGRCCHRRSYSC